MVYKLGQRVRPKFKRLKLLSIGIVGSLLVGTVATAYANSHGINLLTYPVPQAKHATSGKNVNNSSKTSASKISTGSAHKAAAGQAAPNASLPALASLQTASCTLFPPQNPGLAGALSPELRKLAQYEQLCNGALVDRSSFFVPTPTTVSDAQSDASDVATTLKEYAGFGVKPLVFIEPDDTNGNNLDLVQYQNGAYDSALDAYFSDLKSDGITDPMMGIWVILPEGNIPVWTTTDPAVYSADVIKTIQFQKKYFPASQASILLDSESYPSASSWDNGTYVSLLSYVQNIPKGLVNSFGLQGFPWAPQANQGGGTVYDPTVYLRTDFASEAAHALGVSNIWFNTGTFNQMYTQNAAETVTASPLQRQTMLNGVLAQAKVLQAQGFSVDIHLFAQDKSNTSEAIDWSYWKVQPSNDANTAVFTAFVHDATADNIPLWLFDTYDQ